MPSIKLNIDITNDELDRTIKEAVKAKTREQFSAFIDGEMDSLVSKRINKHLDNETYWIDKINRIADTMIREKIREEIGSESIVPTDKVKKHLDNYTERMEEIIDRSVRDYLRSIDYTKKIDDTLNAEILEVLRNKHKED